MISALAARTAAVVLLLLVCADLGIPSLCSAESIPIFTPAEPESWQANARKPAAPVEPVLGEEDCFCCCSHTYPRPFLSVVEEPRILQGAVSPVEQPVPEAAPSNIFRPPRH